MARRRNQFHTRYRRSLALCLCPFIVSIPAFSQQSGIQSSFLPAIVRLPAASGVLPDLGESDHLPYIQQLARENQGTGFRPNASDLLIQQAEEKFRSGSKLYQSGDIDRARSEFDGAML